MNYAIILFSNQDSPDEQDCQEALKQLEQIKDETDAIGIKFVKTMDKAFVKKYGIVDLPTIVYFEEETPSIYDGKTCLFTQIHLLCILYFNYTVT